MRVYEVIQRITDLIRVDRERNEIKNCHLYETVFVDETNRRHRYGAIDIDHTKQEVRIYLETSR